MVAASITRDRIIAALNNVGVARVLQQQIPDLHGIEALMVYGSQARGDAVAGSDLDLLALVARPRPSVQVGDVHISYYTHEQLATGTGTLFGSHLRRDGKILADPRGQLENALDALGQVDTERVVARSRLMAQLFTTPDRDLPKYLPGLAREARYLLRSCLYAQAIADGAPCFSVRELAIRHADPLLTQLLASRQHHAPTAEAYAECLTRLEAIVGPFPPSTHGSVEATVVNEWGTGTDLLSLAFIALGAETEATAGYAEVEKILL